MVRTGTPLAVWLLLLTRGMGLTEEPLTSGEFGALLPLSYLPQNGHLLDDDYVGQAVFGVLCGVEVLNNEDFLGNNRSLSPVLRDNSYLRELTLLSALEFTGMESRDCPLDVAPVDACGAHSVPLVAGSLADENTMLANRIFSAYDVAHIGSYIVHPDIPKPAVFSRIMFNALWEMRAIIQILKKFNWKRFAIISEGNRWDLAFNMQTLLNTSDIQIVSTQITPIRAKGDVLRRALHATRLAEGKIILVHGDTHYAARLLTLAHEMGMHHGEYQVIGTSQWTYTIDEFLEYNDTTTSLVLGTIGTFLEYDFNLATAKYIQDFFGCLNSDKPQFAGFPGFLTQPAIYYSAWRDIIRVIAGAYRDAFQVQDLCKQPFSVQALERLDDLTSVQTCEEALSIEFRTPLLVELVRLQNFDGGLGPVKFDDTGAVYRKFALYNKRHVEHRRRTVVALLDPLNDLITPMGEDGLPLQQDTPLEELMAWRAPLASQDFTRPESLIRFGPPPLDGTWRVVYEKKHIRDRVYMAVVVLCAVGVAWALFSLVHSIKYRTLSIVRMSSPNINYVCLLGCVLAYSCPLLFGADTSRVGEELFEGLCHARVWMASLSFTLLFGSIFSKTYRVHRIFNSHSHDLVAITDWALLSMLLVLLIVDVVLLSVFSATADYEYRLHEAPPLQFKETYTRIVYQWDECSTDISPVLMWVIVGWKGLLLAAGAWLTFQVRLVHIPALNDSRWVGFSVYNVTLISVVVVPAMALIGEGEIEARFLFLSCAILFMVTCVVLLLFLPKMHAIWTGTTEKWVGDVTSRKSRPSSFHTRQMSRGKYDSGEAPPYSTGDSAKADAERHSSATTTTTTAPSRPLDTPGGEVSLVPLRCGKLQAAPSSHHDHDEHTSVSVSSCSEPDLSSAAEVSSDREKRE